MKTLIKFIFRLFFLILILSLILFGVKKYQDIKKVETFSKEVATLFPENKEQQQLILAIILTESKGKGQDIMQASESAYNETEKITSTTESITYGTKHLKAAQEKAKSLNLDEDAAVQAYNFGLPYLDFLHEAGKKKNSVKMAEKYSKEVLSPLLGNTEGSKYRYYHLRSLLFNGGYLYTNGGNFFYADLVKYNRFFIGLYEKIF